MTRSNPSADGATPPPSASLRSAVLDGVAGLLDASAPPALRLGIAARGHSLDTAQLHAVRRALEEVADLEERTVRDVLGRDGQRVPVHHYRACRGEDAETSWNYRPPSTEIRVLRDAMMDSLVGPAGIAVEGAEGVAKAVKAGKRCLFVGNHESVFDLTVLPHALSATGLEDLARRLTFFVNPKIFNTPFIHFFICKPVGILKVPQNPRIAANESVMDADEIQRRAAHGFEVAGQRLARGDSMVLYPEGLRSEGVLHRFARAYLDLLRPESLRQHGLAADEVVLVPWAHRGVRDLETLPATPPAVSVRFGEPVVPATLFDAVEGQARGVAGHLIGFLVARLLPRDQRGLYGDDAAAYLDHPHFRLRIREHTLADIRAARELAASFSAVG